MKNLFRLNDGPNSGNKWTETWPPPQVISVPLERGEYQLVRQSQITDEEIATMPNVARGAEYDWISNDS